MGHQRWESWKGPDHKVVKSHSKESELHSEVKGEL